MESANLQHHHHLLQDQLVRSSSPPSSGFAAQNSHAWTPNNVILESRQESEIIVCPQLNNSAIIQNSSFQLGIDSTHMGRNVKQEFSVSLPKYTDLLNLPYEQKEWNDLDENVLLNDLAGEYYLNHARNSVPNRGGFSQIHPSTYVSSSLDQPKVQCPSSLEMNMFCYSSHENVGLLKDGRGSFGIDFLDMPNHLPSLSPSKVSSCSFGSTEAKRPPNQSEPKQSTPKKARIVSSSSCPPFKVRKQKLGDRISALQQLVAPFGKTDTASVLMEAIGYIKFLQNQVETLSVPYMKSSHKSRTLHGSSIIKNGQEGEPKENLRSRGLCLVPLSCLSYISTGCDGGCGCNGIWPTV